MSDLKTRLPTQILTADLKDSIESRTSAVRIAQLNEVIEFGAFVHVMNAFITVSVMSIYYFAEHGKTDRVYFWGLVNLFIILARYTHQSLVARDLSPVNSRRSLIMLSLSALAGGLCWAALPFMVPGFEIAGKHAYITLTMVAVSAVATVRGAPFASIAIAYSTPLMLTLAFCFLMKGDLQSYIMCGCTLALALTLGRGCWLGANKFARNALIRHEATLLAASLQKANEEIHEANRVLQVLANGDPLTGLANRAKFNAELRKALSASRADERLALFIIDLDKFKFVNDTLGHAAGDVLLVEVANRLSSALEGAGLAARLGGDEFAVVLPRLRSTYEATVVAQACLDRICAPAILSGREFAVQASLGIGIFPDHAQAAEELFACADHALYKSKDAGLCTAMTFTSDMRRVAERQSRIELDVRDALLAGDVDAWFQPQVDLATGRLVGLEALVRWTHPALGPIGAREIVDAVHARRVHEHLTRLMAEKACSMLRTLENLGHDDLRIAVNLSAQDFAHYNVPESLRSIVERHGLDPCSFELEFTEEALLDPKVHGEELKQLDELGFRLALDDFGMGSTSLNYLMSLRIDRLKIDRSFVNGIATSLHNQALVTAMVALGRMLDIDILVEGVETEADRRMLRQLGCNAGQGYLFARPMPAHDIADWLANREQAA